jgi:polyhydroxybutyrate depolymerase
MKPTILLVSLVLVLAACTSGGSIAELAATPSEPSPGESSSGELHEGLALGDESFDLYVPASYDDSEPAPVLIALHGRPNSSVESQAQLQPLADEEGFIVAYPRVGRQRWQVEFDSPDIDVIRELITELVDTWNADPGRVYVTGMSAGGDMAISIGVQLSYIVAAIAPVAPPGADGVAELVDQHGTAVPVVAFVGAEDTRFADTSLDLLGSWRDGVGCGQEDRDAAEELTTSTWKCGEAEMTVHVVAGAGHVWFGGPDAREPLWASAAMWDFFITVAATNAAAPGGEGYNDIEFAASDGEQRAGRLFGDGDTAVVLSHMGRSGDDTRQLHEWATGPSELLIFESRQHGTAIYDDGEPNASELTQAMLDFVDRVAHSETAPC